MQARAEQDKKHLERHSIHAPGPGDEVDRKPIEVLAESIFKISSAQCQVALSGWHRPGPRTPAGNYWRPVRLCHMKPNANENERKGEKKERAK